MPCVSDHMVLNDHSCAVSVPESIHPSIRPFSITTLSFSGSQGTGNQSQHTFGWSQENTDMLAVDHRAFTQCMFKGMKEIKFNPSQKFVLYLGLICQCFQSCSLSGNGWEEVDTFRRKMYHLSEHLPYSLVPYHSRAQHLLFNGLGVGSMYV